MLICWHIADISQPVETDCVKQRPHQLKYYCYPDMYYMYSLRNLNLNLAEVKLHYKHKVKIRNTF